MITKEQLQAMSDRQVDCALCEIVHDSKIVANLFNEGNHFAAQTKEGVDFYVPNYCNTPNDIMPLAFEHGISFLNAGNGLMFTATNNYELLCDKRLSDPEFKEAGGIYFIDVEPLRAIACCLILVLQEKKQ